MCKHAYLIMAHHDDYLLRSLVRVLDDPRNDLYIHMDKKVGSYSQQEIERLAHASKVIHTCRIDVAWGDYTQIEAEMILLSKALETGGYEYYHLISGVDFPIKSQDEIHEFFHKNRGHEFVQFSSMTSTAISYRVDSFHLFQHMLGREAISRPSAKHIIPWAISKSWSLVQSRYFPLNTGIELYKGANWFSITDALAQYVVDKRTWIERAFKHSLNGDEVFLQTIIGNSSFAERLYHTDHDGAAEAIMRYIDWNRGKPYEFTVDDLAQLEGSDMLFARKIKPSDKNLIDALSQYVSSPVHGDER